ncbi:DNA polymerase gamma [Histoplasma capsulatum G186AR]|uniref:DNA-directed DNA polymerase n=2 Tax=Ajellomyces capsulatus TaxID=5037 RepID=C0NFH4_AJECG|nr:DNA polymerase gamma [Histoplasma capsulatum G186AR]EEH09995.1 DNA polymerase gamma [Histoplasma capsulatum G186AR]KAG5291061.1 DNA polymerase gamma [Histoplasma capsulatum]QSS72989.1 DNA polymerase gamma [Histoplasma capsulatum G186AR]
MLLSSCATSRGVLRISSKTLRLPVLTRPTRHQRLDFRWYTAKASASPGGGENLQTLAVPSTARFNEIGVQQLSSHVHSQIFLREPTPPNPELIALSKDHLSRHDLLGKTQEGSNPIAFDIPPLEGQTMDEHFYKLGMDCSEPYLTNAKQYAKIDLPPIPKKWIRRSGWTKYNANGTSEAVDAPNEEMITFDTEVMWKESSFAVMACAASPSAWYAWLSPYLLGETENERQLIPLGSPSQARIIVGHNVGYDRARTLEEYNIKKTRNFFIDTMSLHVAVNGMCSQQRPTWMRHRKNRDLRDKLLKENNSIELAALLENKLLTEEEEELWVGRSSVNSLRDVAKFHCNVTIDKAQRDHFGDLDRSGILERLDELLDYCAADVSITHRVYKQVFPNFLEVCPHPVSFGALQHLSSVILPVNNTWDEYLKNAEETYQRRLEYVQKRLVELCDSALAVKDKPEVYENDPWLRQLDWSGQEIRMVKGRKKGDPPRPAARQKMPGMPKWYKALFPTSTSAINLSVRTRLAPILLKLSWLGYPLVWSDVHGWTFQVPKGEIKNFENQAVAPCNMAEEKNLSLRDDREHLYFKLPHKDGPDARCSSPLAKGYLQYFEGGKLSSQFALAKEALEMNASCSYWISARDRIMSQMVVYHNDIERLQNKSSSNSTLKQGYILPQIIPMGTITRRAVENTWLTASNAKANRVGSELKAMVRAPPGYVFVGADVDSEELWIASLVGDAQFQIHGGNAIGFMTLEGTKSAGTDLHSKTANILGISRNDAKVFNYGRIYGAGLKFAATLLRQFNPSMSEQETKRVAAKLYEETKGTRTNRKILSDNPFWRGGTESFVFNKLEEFAEQERPRTPVLGAGITEALMRRFINKGSFMTSRINWAIQSSGVDYLHLLIISMDFLIRRFNLDARLAITVHDEIRYLVKEHDKYRAAMALQVANLWTRAMFSQEMGIDDLPQSCAYFSAVDIDTVLRKEVDMDCVTPSHPNKIPHGESLDIENLLKKGFEAQLDPSIEPTSLPTPEKYHYTPRKPVLSSLQSSRDPNYIKAQICNDDKELREIIKGMTMKSSQPASNSSSSVTKSTTSYARSRRTKSTIPPHAEPQRAILMEVQPALLNGSTKQAANFVKSPHFSAHRAVWKPRPSPGP